MAENIVQGLFGISVDELNAQRRAQSDAAALQHAQLDPMQSARMGMFQAGAGMVRPIAGAMGYVDPAEVEAKQREGILSQVNMDDPQGILKAAELAKAQGNTKLQVQLQMLARQRESEISKNALEAAQTHKAMQPTVTTSPEGVPGKPGWIKQVSKNPDGTVVWEGEPYLQSSTNINVNGGGGAGDPKMFRYFQEEKSDREAALGNRGLTDTTKKDIKSMIDSKETISSLFGKNFSGYATSLTNPDAQANLNSLKDKLATAGLSMTKTASGQSIGAISVTEWPKLEGMIGRLNNSLTEEGAIAELTAISEQLEKMQGIYEKNYHDTWSTIPKLYKPDLVGKKQPTTSDSELIKKYLKK